MIDIQHASPDEHFQEFRRLHKKKVECLEAADQEYLQMMWYYPVYRSRDLFLNKYPEHSRRVSLLQQLRDNAVRFARAIERAELDVKGMAVFRLNR